MTKEDRITLMYEQLKKFASCTILTQYEERCMKNIMEEWRKLMLSPKAKLLNSELVDVFPFKDIAARLKSFGKIRLVEDLVNKKRSTVFDIRGIGPSKMKKIESWMLEKSLTFKDE